MPIFKLDDKIPEIHETAFVAETASIIGDVVLEKNVSVWFGATLRGDDGSIRVGVGSNIQENAVLHADDGYPILISENVTVGHQAMLHGCEIKKCVLIGMQSVIMNGAIIGNHSIVGAGAVVTEGKIFPERSLILGSPAKVVRLLDDREIQDLERGAVHYVNRRGQYKRSLVRIG
ncbi:gamma carbonic anhydrase family protein [Burkholderia sp. Bp8998]|uniref:gamma carbonic anhydrase family protein n=1 Tax=Burkholderia sp. Bp8998 TaxID=2184557 RepID=UPI000F59D65D|nr:gamma carbonic anhydrase family protein [Burkholderia sp. Bp8998]RQS06731.1 gamma carbonic anhydrase family protein [Burkholderia sp. Bp8998]